MVFAEKYIYFRPPNQKYVQVARVLWDQDCKDFLVSDCKPALSNWKNGGPQPDTYVDSVAWETEWLKEIFRKHDHPMPPVQRPAPCVTSTTPHMDTLLCADGVLSVPSSTSASAAPSLLPGVPKLESSEHTDRASAGWSSTT